MFLRERKDVVVVVVVVFRESGSAPRTRFNILIYSLDENVFTVSSINVFSVSNVSFQPTKPKPGEPAAEFGLTRIIIEAVVVVFVVIKPIIDTAFVFFTNEMFI